jgi:preprotein translocase subunit SecG
MTIAFYIVMSLFLFLCVFLILLVLMQKGRGGGISSAFGGGGGNTAFGSKTGDVLTWATSIVFGLFMLLAIILNLIADKVGQPPTIGVQNVAPAAPVSPAAPENSQH